MSKDIIIKQKQGDVFTELYPKTKMGLVTTDDGIKNLNDIVTEINAGMKSLSVTTESIKSDNLTLNDKINSTQTSVGDLSILPTNDKSNIVNSVKEVVENINLYNSNIGNEVLKTTSKTIKGAINEISDNFKSQKADMTTDKINNLPVNSKTISDLPSSFPYGISICRHFSNDWYKNILGVTTSPNCSNIIETYRNSNTVTQRVNVIDINTKKTVLIAERMSYSTDFWGTWEQIPLASDLVTAINEINTKQIMLNRKIRMGGMY